MYQLRFLFFSLFEFGFELNWVWCKQEEPSGFLSLNRVMSLDRFVLTYKVLIKVASFRNCFFFFELWAFNSLEVDLSKELTALSKTALQQPVEAAIQVRSMFWYFQSYCFIV